MKIKRTICIFSGKRGGFGAYMPLMLLIEKDPKLNLQILLGDMHTSKEFGDTKTEAQFLFPKAKIRTINMGAGRGDSPLIRTENLGTCLYKSAKILSQLDPDIVMVHGDRGEHLIIALAALNLNIAITHSQGGENSGNIDDIQRHAITKLAHIHFPETKETAARINKMGEDSWRIFNVGSMYIDRIAKKMYTPFSNIERKYKLHKDKPYGIILYHPDTFETKSKNYNTMLNILAASKKSGMRYFVIYPCSDPGYEGIIKAIRAFKYDTSFLIYKNIDNLDYISLQSRAKIIIGNSSSALIEAPYLGLPALNIGRRQLGRTRDTNVIDTKTSQKDISAKINYVFTNNAFKKNMQKFRVHLGNGKSAEKMLHIIKKLKIDEKLLRKKITY